MGFFKRLFTFITTPEYEEPTPENLAKWENRAPGWVIRCGKCGLEEPFGKYGIRKHAAGNPVVLMRCSRCHKLSMGQVSKRIQPDQSLGK